MDKVVNYDKSVAEMFKDKNNKIFFDNIQRNIADNDSSLNASIKNKIKLATLEIVRRINEILKYGNIEYDLKSLSNILSTYEEFLIEHVLSFSEKRKVELIKKTEEPNFILDEFLKYVDSFFSDNKEKLERGINDIIYIKLQEEVFNTFSKLSSDDQKQRIINALSKYDFKVTKMVEDSVVERNMSLKNTVQETSSKVSQLNEKVPEYSSKKLLLDKAA